MDKRMTRHHGLLTPLFLLAIVAMALCTVAAPSKALADEREVMAHSGHGSNITYYYSTDEAIQAGYAGKTIILDVDWNFTGTMDVADSQTLTIDMNGHLITSQGNDSAIKVEENANLTLTSGTSYTFDYTGYNSRSKDGTSMQITTGGLVTGASNTFSTNGSGIHMEDSSTLTLDNVAVAGNKALKGGGLYLNKNCTVNLKNGATICANYASEYGGGIWCNRENATINIDAASISANYSIGDGGGLYSDADATRVYLTNGAKISENSAHNGAGLYFDNSYFAIESADKTGTISDNVAAGLIDSAGGGIYLNNASILKNDQGSVKGLTIGGNTCTGDAAGIMVKQRYVTIEDCIVKNNVAGLDGGGLYVAYKDCTVKDCTFTGNVCNTQASYGEGGGVYITYSRDLTLAGKCTIKDNTREKNGSADDVYLGESGGAISRAGIINNLEPGSSVGIRTGASNDTKLGTSIASAYVDGAYFMDLDDYHIDYVSGEKALYQRKGAASEATQIKVSVDYPTPNSDLPATAKLSWGTDDSKDVDIVWLDESGNKVTKAGEGTSYRFHFVTGGSTDGGPSFATSIDASKVTLEITDELLSPDVQDAHVDKYGQLNVTSNWFELGYTGNGGDGNVDGGDRPISTDETSGATGASAKSSTGTLPKAGDSASQPLGLLAAAVAVLAAGALVQFRARRAGKNF